MKNKKTDFDFFQLSKVKQYEYILQSMDSVKNAISVYDKTGNLLFANKAFCRNFSISDVHEAIGKNIKDIASENSLESTFGSTINNNWKMFDVLKSGEAAMNWEVRLDAKGSQSAPQFISNDMYPLFDEKGSITGMVEIARLREQDMQLLKNVSGMSADYTFQDIIGTSDAIKNCIQLATKYANSPYNFLITGESGVGKELFAQSIHNQSTRRNGPFVPLNCAALPENLVESELFGYVGGAFTGASKNGQMGKFELANGGTLFLDEIGELPFHFQSKLLRVLETWTITRIGSAKSTPVDVRLVAATNRNLKKMVDEGLFRQDLYYRLQGLSIEIPPLRKRKSDVVLLAQHFLKQAFLYGETENKTLSEDAKLALMEYDWPGNVRELRNVISRVSLLSKENTITGCDIGSAIFSSPQPLLLKQRNSLSPDKTAENTSSELPSLDEIRDNIEKSYHQLLEAALRQALGNKTKAAEILGISRKTFYRMLEKYKDL